MKKFVATFIVLLSSYFTMASAIAVPLAPTTTTQTQYGSNSPGAFLGVSYAFGSNDGIGITLQITSTRHDRRGIVAAGVTYFPASGHIGIPVGIGYQSGNAALTGGYDFLRKAPVLNGGYTRTSKDKTTTTTALIL